MEGTIFGIGNPLLDISVSADDELLQQFEITPGNASMAEPRHIPLYDKISARDDVMYIAGGAAQNTMRAAQWLLQAPGAVTYTGCIGDDDHGKKLKEVAEMDGMVTHYMVTKEERTGTCAVLVKNHERALVANLSAAKCYKVDHFELPESQAIINKAQYFFSTGFFITVSPDTLLKIGKHAAEHNKTFMFSIAAPFVVDFYWDTVQEVVKYSDIIIANESEAAAFAKKMGWDENDLLTAAKKLAELPKENTKRERIVIFTHGPKPVIVYRDGKYEEYPTLPIEQDQIVDLNGAGDAFAGGLVAGLAKGVAFDEAVSAGHYIAHEVIKRSGMTFPATPSFKFSK